MRGLPESFDMAKRVGLFIWVSKQLKGPLFFDELYERFGSSHGDLVKELGVSFSEFDNNCDPWALEKVRLGLPDSRSKTSFSKYVRTGYGLGFFTLEGATLRWLLKPKWMTWLLSKYAADQANTFRLTAQEKVLIFSQLVELDDIFIIPIMKTLDSLPLSSHRWVKNREFDLEYAQNVTEYMETGFKWGLFEDRQTPLINRLRFIAHNLDLLRENNEPTRGFLHSIEPRIHWLIDLSAIDEEEFFKRGTIRPSFSLEKVTEKLRSSYDYGLLKTSIISEYVRNAFGKRAESHTVLNKEEEIAKSVRLSVDALKDPYPTVMPIEPVLASAFAMSSVSLGRATASTEILEVIKSNYTVYRDYRSGLGFLEEKN